MNRSQAEREVLLTAGIDVGSAAIKVVVLQDTGEHEARVLASRCERIRRRDPQHVSEEVFGETLTRAGVRSEDLAYVATTGGGEIVPLRTGHFYGMTAHARGGLFLDREARAVMDIGSSHARAVLIDEKAKVLGHRMTSQCASGSGQFLENVSRYLGVTLAEIGPLSLQADKPEPCSSICAVLAETDVINMISRDISIPNILKGIHESMAERFVRLLISAKAQGIVLVTGGLASDQGLLAAMREAASRQGGGLEIRSHEHSVLGGALGAALWGAFRARKLARKGLSVGAGGRCGPFSTDC